MLFSAHGVPQSYIEAGDPYQRQIEVRLDAPDNEPSLADSVQFICVSLSQCEFTYHHHALY